MGVGSADRKDTSKESGSNKNKLEEMRRKQQEVARQTALQRQKSLLGESERETGTIKKSESLSASSKGKSKESGSDKNKFEEIRRKQQEVARQTALQRQKSLLGESERENDWIKTNEADPKDVSHPDPSPAPSANSKVHS